MPAPVSFARQCGAVSIIWFAVLLGGCAGDVNMLPSLEPDTVVGADQGLVVARFVNAGPYPLPFNQLTVNPQDLNESAQIKPERLLAARKTPDGSTVFASPLTAGSYSLSSIRAFHVVGEVYYSRFIDADVSFGTFDVRPGQITDLGTIVYYPKPEVDRYQDMLLRVPGTATGEVLDQYFPFRDYEPDALLTWNEDGFDEERESRYFSVLQNPVKFERHTKTPDGSLLFLAPLGVIIERTSGGEWLLDAVDTNLELTSVAQSENGDRVVAGSEGRVFHRPPGGEWRDVSLDRGMHVDEVEFGGGGDAVLIARGDKRLVVLRGDLTADTPQWTEINSFRTSSGWQNTTIEKEEPRPGQRRTPRIISAAGIADVGDKHLITLFSHSGFVDSIFASTREHMFRFNPETWVVSEYEDRDGPSAMLDAGAVSVGIKRPGFWSWSGDPKYFVYDESNGDWRRINTAVYRCGEREVKEPRCGTKSFAPKPDKKAFRLISAPWFRSETEAVALVSFSKGGFGSRTSETRLLKSTDGGQWWLDTGNGLPREYCTNLIPVLDDRLLLSCSGANGEFYESFDDGANWQLVREHQNF